MREAPAVAALPGGRLRLWHGPIDLVVRAEGEPAACQAAYAALVAQFGTVLDELCAELAALRAEAGTRAVSGVIAQRMLRAVLPHAGRGFITPMAAVAGAVADEMLGAMTGAAPLRRAYVNNGGDVALSLAEGESFHAGMVGGPTLFGTATLSAADGVGGIATSGWRGRSFSLGIADAVTVCARTAAEADAAATVIANAVDLPGHAAIDRAPARSVQADSDLGDRLVTRGVGALPPGDVVRALQGGVALAAAMVGSGQLLAVALHCQGVSRLCTGDRTDLPFSGKAGLATRLPGELDGVAA